MFDNGSFLRRRKRYKRAPISQRFPFPTVFGPFSPFWIRKPVPVLPIHLNLNNFGNSLECFDMIHTPGEIFESTQAVEKKLEFLTNTDATSYQNSEKIGMIRQNASFFTRSNNSLEPIHSDDIVSSVNTQENYRGANSFSEVQPYLIGRSIECNSPVSGVTDNFQNADDISCDRIDVESENENDSHRSDSIDSICTKRLTEDNETKLQGKAKPNTSSPYILLFDNSEISDNSLPVSTSPDENYSNRKRSNFEEPPAIAFKDNDIYKPTILTLNFEHNRSKKLGNTKDFRIESLIGSTVEAND